MRRPGISGLRKHAAGGSTNTHATGGTDALTPGDIGAGKAPTLKIVDSNTTNVSLTTVEAELTSCTLDTGFESFMLLHIFAQIGTGTATESMEARIRFHFTDATTLDAALSGSAGATPLLLHYDNSAATSVADAWAAAETAVNLHTVIGVSHNAKKVNRVSLRGRRLGLNAATHDYRLRVGAIQA